MNDDGMDEDRMDGGRIVVFNNARKAVMDEFGDQHVVDGPTPYSFRVELAKNGEPVDIRVKMIPPRGKIEAYVPEKLIRDQLRPGDGQTQIWTIVPYKEDDPTTLAKIETPNENGDIRLNFRVSMQEPSKYLERTLFAAVNASDVEDEEEQGGLEGGPDNQDGGAILVEGPEVHVVPDA